MDVRPHESMADTLIRWSALSLSELIVGGITLATSKLAPRLEDERGQIEALETRLALMETSLRALIETAKTKTDAEDHDAPADAVTSHE